MLCATNATGAFELITSQAPVHAKNSFQTNSMWWGSTSPPTNYLRMIPKFPYSLALQFHPCQNWDSAMNLAICVK